MHTNVLSFCFCCAILPSQSTSGEIVLLINSSNLWSNKSLYSMAYVGSKLYKGPFSIALCRWLDLLAAVCPIFALIQYIQTLGFREKWETNITIPTCSPLKDQRPTKQNIVISWPPLCLIFWWPLPAWYNSVSTASQSTNYWKNVWWRPIPSIVLQDLNPMKNPSMWFNRRLLSCRANKSVATWTRILEDWWDVFSPRLNLCQEENWRFAVHPGLSA